MRGFHWLRASLINLRGLPSAGSVHTWERPPDTRLDRRSGEVISGAPVAHESMLSSPTSTGSEVPTSESFLIWPPSRKQTASPAAVKLGTSSFSDENQMTRRSSESSGTISMAETVTFLRSGGRPTVTLLKRAVSKAALSWALTASPARNLAPSTILIMQPVELYTPSSLDV